VDLTAWKNATTDEDIADTAPNAVHIIGQPYRNAILRYAMSAFNYRQMGAPVNSIATAVPRKLCFLVDMSGSMVGDTHKDSVGSAKPYFSISEGASSKVTGFPVGNYTLISYTPDSNDDDLHPLATTHTLTQFGADSKAYNNENYYIQNTAIPVPEPLTSAMLGIDTALQFLQQRAVTGDEACLIFYDQYLYQARVFNLTSDFARLRKYTNWNDPDAKTKSLKNLIFPFDVAFTNLPIALIEALRQFTEKRAAGEQSSNAVVIIGDGITNCYSDCYTQDNLLDDDTVPLGNPASGGCAISCSNDIYAFFKSSDMMQNIVLSNFVTGNIPIHVMLVGSRVQPHSTNITNPDNDCYSEAQKRKLTQDLCSNQAGPAAIACYVSSSYNDVLNMASVTGSSDSPFCSNNPNCFPKATGKTPYCEDTDCYKNFQNAMNSDTPPDLGYGFLYPNQTMFAIAQFTGGAWLPIRPGSDENTADSICTQDPGCSQLTQTSYPGIDGTIRFYDPDCASKAVQFRRAMLQVLKDSPYYLVEARGN